MHHTKFRPGEFLPGESILIIDSTLSAKRVRYMRGDGYYYYFYFPGDPCIAHKTYQRIFNHRRRLDVVNIRESGFHSSGKYIAQDHIANILMNDLRNG